MITDDKKQLITAAQAAKEALFKLVVKIICWETGSLGSVTVRSDDKITTHEWMEYKKNQLSIATEGTLLRIKEKLAQSHLSIKEHGGFDSN